MRITLSNAATVDPLSLDFHRCGMTELAHALSNEARWGGHTTHHYSVAEHSCLVALLVARSGGDRPAIRHGLLHDLAEALVKDLPRPIKDHCGKPYAELERRVTQMLAMEFKRALPPTGSPSSLVKRCDIMAEIIERNDLFPPAAELRAHNAERMADIYPEPVPPLPNWRPPWWWHFRRLERQGHSVQPHAKALFLTLYETL